jgi:hypothetical protein
MARSDAPLDNAAGFIGSGMSVQPGMSSGERV